MERCINARSCCNRLTQDLPTVGQTITAYLNSKMQMLITEHHSSQMMSEYSTIDERLKQLQREQK